MGQNCVGESISDLDVRWLTWFNGCLPRESIPFRLCFSANRFNVCDDVMFAVQTS